MCKKTGHKTDWDPNKVTSHLDISVFEIIRNLIKAKLTHLYNSIFKKHITETKIDPTAKWIIIKYTGIQCTHVRISSPSQE